MNTPFDKAMTILRISNPNATYETLSKELIKYLIRETNFPKLHEANLESIVDKAKDPIEMSKNIDIYMSANKLFF